MRDSELETCPVCGGDGRIQVSHDHERCPACHGSGRRALDTGFHDVTKTKPSHHHPKDRGGAKAKQTWPETGSGRALADEVKAASIPDEQKEKLTRSIIDYENSKGTMTKTFSRLLRKQLRALVD